MNKSDADKIIPIRQSREEKKIIELIKKFKDFSGIIPGHFLQNWNDKAFDKWAAKTSISTGELIVARFILGVWNRLEEWKVGRFDLFEAADKLDLQNWQVIIEWCKNPFLL